MGDNAGDTVGDTAGDTAGDTVGDTICKIGDQYQTIFNRKLN